MTDLAERSQSPEGTPIGRHDQPPNCRQLWLIRDIFIDNIGGAPYIFAQINSQHCRFDQTVYVWVDSDHRTQADSASLSTKHFGKEEENEVE